MTETPAMGWAGWQKALDGVAAILMTVASSLLLLKLVWPGKPVEPPLPRDPIPIDGAASRGHARAPVVMIEFADFQCPFCAAFATRILPDLEREFIGAGKLRLVVRHLPLESVHSAAKAAAIGAVCAHEQGRFWELHDDLFRMARPLHPESIGLLARSVSDLDFGRFAECTETRGPAVVAADIDMAAALGVSSTPSFFVGMSNQEGVRVTERVLGAAPLQVFRDAITAALRKGQPSGGS